MQCHRRGCNTIHLIDVSLKAFKCDITFFTEGQQIFLASDEAVEVVNIVVLEFWLRL